VYFSEIPTTFDPQLAYLDNTAASLLSLMYEGLYKYDAKGKVVKGLATGYKWIENDDKTETYIIEITSLNIIYFFLPPIYVVSALAKYRHLFLNSSNLHKT